MKLALVSTPDTAEPLLAHLAPRFDVRLFVAPADAGRKVAGTAGEPADELLPREHDQILHALADTPAHGFVLPVIRTLGGVVAMRAWELGAAARAAFPALGGDGLGARLARLREGSALNRSAVRFGDAFLVPDAELRRRILEERNAPTPVAVVPGPEGFAEPLEAFPRPRGARKRMFWMRVRRAARAKES